MSFALNVCVSVLKPLDLGERVTQSASKKELFTGILEFCK